MLFLYIIRPKSVSLRFLFFIILSSFLCFSCSNSVQDQLEHLNGYWEIESVTNVQNVTKSFTISQTIDYIEVDGEKGFRKKLQPDLYGNYKTTNSIENIEVNIANDVLELHYSTAFSSWRETVIRATATQLIVANEDHIQYTYKRYTPINIDN